MAVLALPAGGLRAEQAGGAAAVSTPAVQTVVDVLHGMSDRAAVIFAGQVLSVQAQGSSGGSPGVVEIRFRVDEAVRGCSAGTVYVLREWGGLWSVGQPRYKVGQRLFLLLHAANAAGISSPVDGLNGAIPIRQGATTRPFGDGQTGTVPFADLRWLGVRVPRAVVYSPVSAAAKSRRLGVARMVTAQTSSAGVNLDADAVTSLSEAEGSVPAQQASVAAMVTMLTGWQGAQHGAN